jgi:hypothetical protein
MQNVLFAVFMVITIFSTLVQQVSIATQALRRRPS